MALAGSKGSSQSKTDSQSTTVNTQTTSNYVDNSVRTYTSDENALLALTDVSREAFQAASDMADSVVGGAFGALTDISSDSINLGRDALGTAERATAASLDNARLAYGSSLDFAADITSGALDSVNQSTDRVERFATEALTQNSDLVSGVFDFARELFGDVTAAQETLADTNLTGLTALASQNSATSEDRISKIVIYAIIAVAVILVAPRIFK